MISFKNFLIESRSAPLYHGTNIDNLHNILIKKQGLIPITRHSADDLLMKTSKSKHSITMDSSFSHTPYKFITGVSASRTVEFARRYRGIELSAVLILDQKALAQRYMIKPIQYWSGDTSPARKMEKQSQSFRNEYEEFIITSKNIPVKYITGIIIDKSTTGVRQKYIDEIRATYGSSFIKTYD